MRIKNRNPIETKINIYVGSSLATGRTLIRLRYVVVIPCAESKLLELFEKLACFQMLCALFLSILVTLVYPRIGLLTSTKNNIFVQFIDVSIDRYNFARICHVLYKVSIIIKWSRTGFSVLFDRSSKNEIPTNLDYFDEIFKRWTSSWRIEISRSVYPVFSFIIAGVLS